MLTDKAIGEKTIARLSMYRRMIGEVARSGQKSIYSHELAALTGVSAAQVRRDFMNIGYSGNPNRGYDLADLAHSIGKVLDDPEGQYAALVGVGNMGRAFLDYFSGRRPKLSIVATFENDPDKIGRVIQGHRCYPVDEMKDVVAKKCISVGIITVPASDAQKVADAMVAAGITALLNFAPVHLNVPETVFVEDIDLTTSLEKVAYFARTHHI